MLPKHQMMTWNALSRAAGRNVVLAVVDSDSRWAFVGTISRPTLHLNSSIHILHCDHRPNGLCWPEFLAAVASQRALANFEVRNTYIIFDICMRPQRRELLVETQWEDEVDNIMVFLVEPRQFFEASFNWAQCWWCWVVGYSILIKHQVSFGIESGIIMCWILTMSTLTLYQ